MTSVSGSHLEADTSVTWRRCRMHIPGTSTHEDFDSVVLGSTVFLTQVPGDLTIFFQS